MSTRVLLADNQFLTRKAIASLIRSTPGFDLAVEVDNPMMLESEVETAQPDLVVVDLYGKENELIIHTLHDLKELPIMMESIKEAWRRGENQKLEEVREEVLKKAA
mgnify:CR=1 FL=1